MSEISVTHPAGKKNLFRWLTLATMLGGMFLRLIHLFSIPLNTPFHLGGLFYEFSLQIIQNDFALPRNIPYYSLGGLPFAYPPLGFYLQAIWIKVFNPAPFLTVNLLPALIAALSVPAFYWLIKSLTDEDSIRLAALLAFALMPSAFINQIEAGGLADSLGTLAIIIYLASLFRFQKDPSPAPALLAGFFLGMCILSSPGSAYAGTLVSIFFFFHSLWLLHQSQAARKAFWLLLTGLTGLIVSVPYWLVLLRHGEMGGLTTAFFNQQDVTAFANQIRYMLAFKPADMITFIGDEGTHGFLLDWLIFGGMFWALLNKHKFQVLIFFTFWLIPREGCWLVAIPAAWLAGLGITRLLLPMLGNAFKAGHTQRRPPLAPGVIAILLLILAVGGAWNALEDLKAQPQMRLSEPLISGLPQEGRLIPVDAHVLVAGDIALREWAPALLEREVLNCEFGLEWQPSEYIQVSQINQALLDNDLESALQLVEQYSGDTGVWLVGDPGLTTRLIAAAGTSLEASIASTTPELMIVYVKH